MVRQSHPLVEPSLAFAFGGTNAVVAVKRA
jgi:hypothetical protein